MHSCPPVGCVGVWDKSLQPGQYYFNPEAFALTEIDTRAQVCSYGGGAKISLTVDAKGDIVQNRTEVEVPKDKDNADVVDHRSEIAMNHTTLDMIEIKNLSASMIEDGTDALVTCLVKKEGMVRLKMNRAVLEDFCKQAIQELARKRTPDSGD